MRAGNMLLQFSLSNLNKRACRVLKWLAIETIDEQLFLHEARTGYFFRQKTYILPSNYAFFSLSPSNGYL